MAEFIQHTGHKASKLFDDLVWHLTSSMLSVNCSSFKSDNEGGEMPIQRNEILIHCYLTQYVKLVSKQIMLWFKAWWTLHRCEY